MVKVYAIIAFFVIMGFLLIRNCFTYRNQGIIATAIHLYNLNYIVTTENLTEEDYKANTIDYCVIENYYVTFTRIWDWGYKNLVPKDIYEKIKEFI